MAEAVRSYFRNYANFYGRTSRGDYWLVQMFHFFVVLVLTILSALLIFPALLLGLWILVNLVPSFSLFVRRMHDRNVSGWMALLFIIPTLGSFIMLFLTLLPGTPGVNTYGPPYETWDEESTPTDFYGIQDDTHETETDYSSYDNEDDWDDF